MANENALIAKEMYKRGKSLKDIADRLKVSPATVRSWKNRAKSKGEDWGEADCNNATQQKCNVAEKAQHTATQKARVKMIASVECNDELTESEKEFCLHYAERPNATRAYQKAYPDSTYGTSNAEGCKLLAKPSVKGEIQRLKAIKRESFIADPEDLVQLMWRIAFAGMDDFVEWGNEEIEIDGDIRTSNYIRFKNSDEVDAALVSEVKKGKDGVSVKLISKEYAVKWLTDYFEMKPMDKHRKDFDNRRLAIEEKKIQKDPSIEPIEIILKRE